MSFSIMTYLIAGAAAAFVFLFWLMNYYKAKSKRIAGQLEQANVMNAQLQTEIKHVQIKQKIEADNFALDGDQLDERMREKGYYRQQ
ncbi:DUF2681 domain-containing protein [Vibrio algicola]|uniref:DUF2681 domain-containing protein n=1 Tax=Vibrio algicola TaxID=2662262 RepID=A0A5Q0TIP8_9VIBR|nr:DUF2681 domain-containing protein [Vibrio algicola]